MVMIDRPVLVLGTEPVGGPHVLAVDPPLHHPGLDQVASRDLAGQPGEPLLLPVVLREETGVREERIGRPAPRHEHVASGQAGPPFHHPLVESLDGEGFPVQPAPVLVELFGGIPLDELRGDRVVRREVRHHVSVPPPGERTRLLPGLRIGVLDGPAEPLALGLRDAEQRGAVQAHGAESYSTGHAPSRGRSGCSGSAGVMDAIERFTESARRLGVEPRIRRFPEGTKTAEAAALAIGCDVAQIVKSLVFMADGRPVIAFTSGANRVDPSKLARSAGAAEARRASPEEARAATGFAVGGTPPFGHPDPCPPTWTRLCLPSKRSGRRREHRIRCSRCPHRSSSGPPEPNLPISPKDDGVRR